MLLLFVSLGGFHKAIYALRLKLALCAHLFSLILQHVFVPNTQLIVFSPRMDALYALRRALNFYKIHPLNFVCGQQFSTATLKTF